jgi:TM2 domain-containing membrane protein YozV
MNCANHPDITASAYCQNCGKPLCKECVRGAGGLVFCEPCLAARLGVPGAAMPGAMPEAGAPFVMPPQAGPNPALAGLLGFIPGVGAMYNGQFVKGLVHVLVFAILVSLSHSAGVFGIFIAAWVFYQVFDAVQTARARRDGLPLPDPFGLNDLGRRMGLHGQPGAPPFAGGEAVPPGPGAPAGFVPPAPGGYTGGYPNAGYVPPAAPYGAPYGTVPPAFDPSCAAGGRRPTGAIVLIALGVLFLFGSLGILNEDWLGRGWPLVIIGLGVWLLIRRSREMQSQAAGRMPGVPGSGVPGSGIPGAGFPGSGFAGPTVSGQATAEPRPTEPSVSGPGGTR